MKRSKNAINGWMRRKRGIFRRWAKSSTVKTKTRVNFTQMPEQYTTRRPPKPDKRGTVMHDVPRSRIISTERLQVGEKRLEISKREDWITDRHHGSIAYNFKLLESRGKPPWYWLRVYFHQDEVVFIHYLHGEVKESQVFHGLEATMNLYKRFGKSMLLWKE